jgi:polysaccharide biosynthesis transport protein
VTATQRPPGGATTSFYVDGSEAAPFSRGQLQHFLHAPMRRPLMVLVPWAASVLLSAAALFYLPKQYRSSTLILIESERVPDSFVARVATEDRSRNLNAIRSEIFSRTRLARIVEETKPFPGLESETAAVEIMRGSVAINSSGTDGFTIEFIHSDPRKAQEVTNRLATLFIEETMKARQQQVEGAVDFLVTQVNDARRELEKKDEAMRRYKEERMGRLPEQLQTNLTTMGMLQQELRSVEETLLFARERQEALARGAAREPSSGSPGPADPEGTDELAALRAELARLKTRYTAEHPDVQSLQSRIARLESRAALSTADTETAPAGALTREQLERAKAEVKRLEEKRADLEGRIAGLRARVEETPRTEQELANLKRDYDKLNENYTALLSKQLEAQMAGRLEQRWRGDRFRMLDPANLPEKPYSPKPPLVIGLGLILGLLAGLGAALVAEYLDPTIKDTQDLESFLEYPVLARIPLMPRLGSSRTR